MTIPLEWQGKIVHPQTVAKRKSKGGRGKGVFIELKNTNDQLMSQGKFRVEFPDTDGSFKSYSIDFGHLITSQNDVAAVFVFSDPDTRLQFKDAITFTSEPAKDSIELLFDRQRFR